MLRWLYAQAVFIPTFAWNVLIGRWLKLRRWWDRIDDHVILGALPLKSDAPRLAAEGVRAVVNTCEEYPGPLKEYERLGIEQLRVPTIDFTHPTLENVEEAVRFIQDKVKQGETVYIHCKAGRARSATVALCWLVEAKGMSPQEAQQYLLKCRPHVNRHLTRRPVVQEFCRRRTDER